jgi:hypothetical protein
MEGRYRSWRKRLRQVESNFGLLLFFAPIALPPLIAVAMLVGGILMARHELSVRNRCQRTEGIVVGRTCGEGPPCSNEISFTDEQGVPRSTTSNLEKQVGEGVVVCFVPGTNGSEVYLPGHGGEGIVLALLGLVGVVGTIRFLTTKPG